MDEADQLNIPASNAMITARQGTYGGLAVIACALLAVYSIGWIRQRAVQSDLAQRAEIIRRENAVEQKRMRMLHEEAARFDAAGVRLTDVDRFDAVYRDAVRATIERLKATGLVPHEYLAYLEKERTGISLYLRHQAHPTNPGERGDACG